MSVQGSEERSNEIILQKRDINEWEVNTYYQEDKDIPLNTSFGDLNVDQLYLAPIRITKNENGYEVSYTGPLYAQCTGGQCMPQKYKFHVNKCGEISELNNPKTDLQNYAPKKKSLHTPITKKSLSRLQFYANNPKILSALYKDMAGEDLKSNYILGNSVGPEATNTAASGNEDDLKLGSGARWAANPWGTNTMATLW